MKKTKDLTLKARQEKIDKLLWFCGVVVLWCCGMHDMRV